VTSEHASSHRRRHEGLRRGSAGLWATLGGVGLAVLLGGAVAANGVVAGDNDPGRVAQASLGNAVLWCLNTQTHSLVRPGQPVTVALRGPSDFANLTTLLQATEGWLTIEPPRASLPVLSITATTSPPSCHGLAVQGTFPQPGGGQRVRRGTGASVPGHGGLPPPQL
jgi:hypothetical protein